MRGIEYQQSLVFTISFALLAIFGMIVAIKGFIQNVISKPKCNCQYNWNGYISKDKELPKCIHCNEQFKKII
jgi:hypothetical protein